MICRVCKKDTEQRIKGANICRLCYAAYMRSYNAKNREKVCALKRAYQQEQKKNPEWVAKVRKKGREYWQNMRHKIILAYGGYRCNCCGETEPSFLSIDHVNNDGAAHRRSLGYAGNGKGGSSRTLKWIRDNNYPPGFQVLCMNCQFGKVRNKGICPHQDKNLREKIA